MGWGGMVVRRTCLPFCLGGDMASLPFVLWLVVLPLCFSSRVLVVRMVEVVVADWDVTAL